jgi:3-methyladenine DNA glycosylase AlkD
MTAQSILEEIRPLGRDSYKRILFNHGVQEPCFGVKIEDLKKIQKRVRMDYQLALDLYDTGVYDAMYLAGLIADDARMTKKDLKRWLAGATHAPLFGWTIPSVAAGSPHGWELALEWIESKKESAAIAGWATIGAIVGVKPDTELDLATLKTLLQRVEKTIHQAPDKLRYQMNSFVIAVGCHVKPLSELALRAAEKIGPLVVDMGDTACQVPFAPDYIRKVEKRGTLGKKRKSAKC